MAGRCRVETKEMRKEEKEKSRYRDPITPKSSVIGQQGCKKQERGSPPGCGLTQQGKQHNPLSGNPQKKPAQLQNATESSNPKKGRA